MSESRRTPFDDLDPLTVLTTAKIAARLDVDPRSVRRAIDRGDLPASRACGLRVLAADAAEWWRSCAAAPVPRRQRVPERPVETVSPRRVMPASERLPLPPRGGRGR